jgi:formylglycine-generating enzyme required for sulfatase activity
MVIIPGGQIRTGSDRHYPEERPVQERRIAMFGLDATQVTNREFAEFVAETGWRTQAERNDPPGSMVFTMTSGPTDLRDPARWWRFVENACWHAPGGAGTSVEDRQDYPVVHVAQADAAAFAGWRGARLPNEWEWEAAARGGLDGAVYCWGDIFAPEGRVMANVWSGAFPWYFASEGEPGTMPVRRFPPNGFGLFDMAGNVWEWTTSFFDGGCGCVPPGENDRGGRMIALRGGSFLCAAEYCLRYRPAARIAVHASVTTSHIGFRCAWDVQAKGGDD